MLFTGVRHAFVVYMGCTVSFPAGVCWQVGRALRGGFSRSRLRGAVWFVPWVLSQVRTRLQMPVIEFLEDDISAAQGSHQWLS